MSLKAGNSEESVQNIEGVEKVYNRTDYLWWKAIGIANTV